MRVCWRVLLALLLVVVPCARPCVAQDSTANKATNRDGSSFETVVAPLLARRCAGCHAGDEAKGKLDLTTREKQLAGGESGPALVPGQVEKSLLWQRVVSDEMPPKHPLTEDEKRLLKTWIEMGAAWSGGALNPLAVSSEHRAGFDWWSLQPLTKASVPDARDASRFRQPLDAFVAAQLEARGLKPSHEADRRTLIRRLSFDLLGLPPSPDEVDEFANDPAPDAYERLVDRLLASPHYGERWARHWLDVVRFGESNGFERDLPRPNAWHYRNWVIDALNRDVPYDEFVRWQLAGDVIAPDDVEAMKAVGFLVAGAHDTVVPVVDRMRAMMRQDELEDTVGTLSQTFLGLTVNCARCHDHKFDPISTREYYQIAAALSGVDHGERDFTSSEVTRQLNETQSRIDSLARQLREQESPIREAVLAERKQVSETKREEDPSPPAPHPARPGREEKIKAAPTPLAAWDFARDLNDQLGGMHATLHGSAKLEAGGLQVDGTTAFASTAPLARDLVEKTLEVRVRLKTLDQRGGGAICLQTTDGQQFDAIVFGENEPRRWMAGSNGFVRTLSFEGTAEEQADKEFVVIAQVYRADGTITGYRNGQPYSKPIRKDAALKYEAGKSQIVFGLRHGTSAGDNRMLSGLIASARLYDKALSAEEVAIAAGSANTFVTEAEIAAKLPVEDRATRAASQAELHALRLKHADLTKNGPVKLYTAIATQPPPMKVHQRGSVTSLGEEVAPAGLAAIKGLDASFGLKPDAIESHRRLALANWITDSRNPLFARVMANRVWHYHFGTGLVETPNDLGFHSGRPSHPELLEWIAGEFNGRQAGVLPSPPSSGERARVRGLSGESDSPRQSASILPPSPRRGGPGRGADEVSDIKSLSAPLPNPPRRGEGTGADEDESKAPLNLTLSPEDGGEGTRPRQSFSIKRLHRLVVTSATYRQASTFDEAAAKVDAGNRLLWRMNPHRLEAESVRDAMLSVAGELNNELGGKGYSDTNSYFFKGTPFYDPIDPTGYTNHRRTVYRMSARGGRSPFLDTFDCPDPSTTTPKRSSTVTPLQALSLMNHSFVLRMADQFASRLKRESGESVEVQVRAAYRQLYGRIPNADEVAMSVDFIKRRGLPAFCRAMWNSSEFLFVD